MNNIEKMIDKNKQKHLHDDKNCSCNKDCKNCKTEELFDLEKINKARIKEKEQILKSLKND